MEMNEMTSPLFMLRVVESSANGIYYRIAVEGGDQSEPPRASFSTAWTIPLPLSNLMPPFISISWIMKSG
jgi:hypothetical protein